MFELLNKSTKKGGFGLYITDQYVQAAQLKSSGSKLAIAAAGQEPLSPGVIQNGIILDKEVLAEAINKLLKTTKPSPIRDAICYIAIPENQIYEYVFILPEELTGIELKRKIQTMVKETMPLPSTDIIYRYIEVISKKSRYIHLYAARKQVLKDYLDVVRNKCKLSPQALEPESNALIRVLQRQFPQMTGSLLLNERDNKIYWFTLLGDKVFESGIVKTEDGVDALSGMMIDLKRSAETLTSKTGVEIKEIILPEELNKKVPTLKEIISQEFTDIPFQQEKYHIGNYYYKVSCSLGMKPFSIGANSEINFQK